MKIIASAKCPYCQTQTPVGVETDQYRKSEVVTCEPEFGGCEAEFVFSHFAEIKVSAYKIDNQWNAKRVAALEKMKEQATPC